MNQPINQTASGTFTGTLLVLLMQITSPELLKTIILAAVGALVSFIASGIINHFLKWWSKQ